MGKDEDKTDDESSEEKTDSKKDTAVEKTDEEIEETEDKPAEPKPEKKEDEPKEDAEEKEKDAESLRKVIKVDSKDEKKEKPAEKKNTEDVSDEELGDSSTREGLEQKRAILQSIKDFDFQIKKNQEEITGVNQKLDGITKDLDDLVSLYEIVSEQMNPFVGLSKVTKKRLDALENFTREIDLLKERTGELESFAERSGAKLKSMSEIEQHAKTIDTNSLLGEDKIEKQDETDNEEVNNKETEQPTEEEINEKTDTEIPQESSEEVIEEAEPTEENIEKDMTVTPDTTYIEEPPSIIEKPMFDNSIFEGFSDYELDMLLDQAFGVLSPEGKIDMIIDDFIESLKD